MPIEFHCACGRKFRTADENAGRSATCPSCRAQLVVPAAEAVPAPARTLPPPLPDDDEPAAAPRPAYDLQSEEVAPRPRRARPSSPYGWSDRDDPGDPDDARPRRRPAYDRDDIRARIIRRPTPSSNPWTEGGVLKGLGLMVLGALITVGGLAVGWLIFPGPVLFIVGVIALIKGIGSGKM